MAETDVIMKDILVREILKQIIIQLTTIQAEQTAEKEKIQEFRKTLNFLQQMQSTLSSSSDSFSFKDSDNGFSSV